MPKDIIHSIREAMTETPLAHGAPIRTLTLSQTEQLAGQYGMSLQEVEIAALKIDVTPLRYIRNQNTIPVTDQLRLLQSKVAIIGLGGLGGSVVEILARAGVGHMVLVDGDRFEEHNLNRQLLCTLNQIGYEKVHSAKARIAQIDSAINVETYVVCMTHRNATHIIERCNAVADCLDNIHTRFELEAAAKSNKIPMVSSAIAGKAGHVTTIWPEDAGLELIYGARDTIQNPKGAEMTLGCPPQTVMLIAAMQSEQILKILLNQTAGLLRNKLWVMDLSGNTFETFSLVADSEA